MSDNARELEGLLHQYVLAEHIGTGASSIVRKAIHKESGQLVAIKIVFRQYNVSMARAKNQVQIISRLDHPNIIAVYDLFEGVEGICIVMEYMEGGQLFERVAQTAAFSQLDVCSIMKKLVDAVRYCHTMQIVHRDIKPENLLLSSNGPDAELKLADFGISKILTDQTLTTNCGTPIYMAPEIIFNREYSYEVDIWSVGITMYYLLSAEYPFKGQTLEELAKSIKNEQIQFRSSAWDSISFRAKNLIRRLLDKNPQKRPKAAEILEDPWFAEMDQEKMASQQTIRLEFVVKNMKKHNIKKKVRRARNQAEVIAKYSAELVSRKHTKEVRAILKMMK